MSKPSIEDVRQMYAYHHYFTAKKVALLCPGEHDYISGNFMQIDEKSINTKQECGLMFVKSCEEVGKWQEAIVEQVEKWIGNGIESQ